MVTTENLLSELIREAEEAEDGGGGLPPGFRFHPTDEELITFYLASKVFNGAFFGFHIPEVDLNRCEPWDLPDVAKMGEREWYFFSLRDRKYPTGLRTNRATGAGYWKATGKDKEIHSASTSALLGMKKTLVFYRGRAPRGEKTKWVMHEYRLEGDFSCRHSCKEEWVICRISQKSMEKRNPLLFEGQIITNSYGDMQESLPQLLDQTPTTTPPAAAENPNFLITKNSQQDIINDIKTMMSPAKFMSQITNHYSSSPSMLIKSLLLSHQLDTQAAAAAAAIPVTKQCKTEPSNSSFNFTTAGAGAAVGMDHGQENLFTFDNIMDCCYYGDMAATEVSPFGGGGGFSRAMASWP